MTSEPSARGRLKVFLGYAAGVGKTYRMLEEAHALRKQGVDVVIGYFEAHDRADTLCKAEGLESVPRRRIEYRGHVFEEMDTDAILARRPAVALVDELAHTNVPGSGRPKRWQDVLVLLEAGIDLFTTVNVQHLESLNDQVAEISGVRVRETVPDWIITGADEVVMVDATVGALLNRLRRGVVYGPEKAQRALENFFKESTLAALRELALRQTAHQVELAHEAAPERGSTSPASTEARTGARGKTGEMRERLLVHVTADPATAMLIRRARRLANLLRADCFALHVSPHPDLSTLPPPERESIEKHLNFARNLHIEARVVEGRETAETLVDFARRHQVTQILLARGRSPRWKEALGDTLVLQVVRLAKDMRVTVVADRRHRGADLPAGGKG